jgi:hypothetical protein
MEHPDALIVVFSMLGGVIAFCMWIERAVNRSEFREECRRRGRKRLRKPSEWEPLDDINGRLWDTYQRRYSYD